MMIMIDDRWWWNDDDDDDSNDNFDSEMMDNDHDNDVEWWQFCILQ